MGPIFKKGTLMGAIFAPAIITRLEEVDPGEITLVELTLPKEFTTGDTTYLIKDVMTPGAAFLASPFSVKTRKWQRRLYTRSNCSATSPSVLQTIINDTHSNSDTSCWWQKRGADGTRSPNFGGAVDIRLELSFSEDGYGNKTYFLTPYEHRIKGDESLKLEVPECLGMRFIGFAFSTGITPFLSHLRFLAAFKFGNGIVANPAHYTLFMSAKKMRQLICHEELTQLAKEFPENFVYHPILTREWSEDWPFTTGRIIRARREDASKEILSVDISSLLSTVSKEKIAQSHIRMCGGGSARDELLFALKTKNIQPLSFKAEAW